MAFKPIKTRNTVQDQVYQQLREALMSGAFEAGEGFTIAGLAEKFSTSHMPVREAIRRLVAENALRITSTGTAIVPALDMKELQHIAQARLIVEPATAALAFDAFGPAEIARLRKNAQAHQQAGEDGDVVAMLAANRDFHFQIYETSGNPVLVSQIENLWLRSGSYVRLLSDRLSDLLQTEHKRKFSGHHDEMLDALNTGNKADFQAAMHRDIAATHGLLESFLADGQE